MPGVKISHNKILGFAQILFHFSESRINFLTVNKQQ